MAKGDARAAADKWLKQQGIIEELDGDQLRQVQELIGNPSFGIFWALLLWRRQRSAMLLTNASLGSPERDCAASVLQGHVRAIDDVKELVLNIAEPPELHGDAAASEKEQTNG